MAATGEGTDVASVDPQQGSEAIVLDLMTPAIAPASLEPQRLRSV
jgi:hypothetical protein